MDLSPDEDTFPGRLLHQAALWDNVEFLEDLLASGAGAAHAEDASGRTALHAAAAGERSRCLRALLAAGARPDARSDERSGGETALHVAAERGHTENVKVLLAGGADACVQDAEGRTALEAAERAGHRHAAALLRDARDAAERARARRHQQLRELAARGDAGRLRLALSGLAGEAGLLVNLAPGGAHTLLYLAAESGATESVAALLAAGADGRAHPVTRYSPLYAAACQGHADIARLLLQHFPELAQQETVERWLPFHAACIGGHVAVVRLLLDFGYPEHMMSTYTFEGGKWRAQCAWDVNARDVSGQTGLYVACTLGNLPLVDLLLRHTLLCTSSEEEEKEPDSPAATRAVERPPTEALSPTRGRISHGIHSIVARLTGQTAAHNEPSEAGRRVRPALLGEGCPGDSCLGAAVRGGHAKVVARLLEAGADPNEPCRDTEEAAAADGRAHASRQRPRSTSALPRRSSPSPSPCRAGAPRADGGVVGGGGGGGEGATTPLALAARARDHRLAELLLAAGAADAGGAALRESALQADEVLLARLLATKAYADPEYKINRSVAPAGLFGAARAGDATLTYSALCPTTPVALDWRDLRAHLAKIRVSWLTQAALRVNAKLSGAGDALHALTRVQLSGNELRELPSELFALRSLRYLNVAQNKLERLPAGEAEPEPRARGGARAGGGGGGAQHTYSAPVLEELYLQDNRLEELPAALFSLPALAALDVSNNKLRALPAAMWRAPRLRDLGAALNHLRDLPAPPPPSVPAHSPPPALAQSPPPRKVSESGSPAAAPAGAAGVVGAFFFGQKVASRSPSVEEGLPCSGAREDAATLGDRSGHATWSDARRVHAWRRALEVSAECGAPPEPAGAPHASPLAVLNLAHNQFAAVPPALACLAPSLTRLNMAYNALRSMSYVTSYPNSLRQLDLSHNEISCWPSLPQVETIGASEPSPLACYCAGAPAAPAAGASTRPRSGGSARAHLLNSVCPARRHLRLESLRTLILANNLLTRIQLTTDDDGSAQLGAAPAPAPAASLDSNNDEEDEWNLMPSVKTRLLFPSLSMLDVSCNLLRAVPPGIRDLANLAVLNVSGNKDITELPPQMGLLTRLWNLNTTGCPLQEPLRTMMQSHKYKTMHVIGYLKSVLEEAQPYNRMKMMLVGAQGRGKTSLLECLRQESAPHHRRKHTEHWSKRMGNKTAGKSPGKNISTVGVDIGTWLYEKQGATTPPVTFNTWDFAGQQEYYATHQYFLSRRSLYLVVWNVTEGRRGLAGVLKWLRSIQARAPGSPAIIVGTHYDAAVNTVLPHGDTAESLQRLIRTRVMCAGDADKLGLPRVWDTLEVSCATRHNVRLLADIIYTCAYSLKPPGSKEPLLEQRVPASYLALEECVAHLVAERRARGLEPVLRHDQYKQQVTQLMQQKFHRSFRDAAELHQATMFLHENGVILHYDDATLKELYFLEPQWLCDMLAHVVTVREINPFARTGIMRLEELQHLFKWSAPGCRGEEARALVVSLLNKFELALGWDGRTLLVPPLLPPDPAHDALILPLRARHWPGAASQRAWVSPPAPHAAPVDLTRASDGADSPQLLGESGAGAEAEAERAVSVSGRGGAERSLRRLLLLSYVPCGFWPRLITRVLADDAVADVPRHYYRIPPEVMVDAATARALELPARWQLWQSGLRLLLGELTLLTVREVPTTHAEDLFGCTAGADMGADAAGAAAAGDGDDYRSYRYRLKQEGVWCELDAQSCCIVEVMLPAEVLCIRRRRDSRDEQRRPGAGHQNISIEPNPEAVARLLALASDHVDLLLEDWYPTLGTRFVHTSEGRCLITRIAPCALCLRDPRPPPPPHPSDPHLQISSALRRLEAGPAEVPVRRSNESRASDGDSGVGAESAGSSRMPSAEGALAAGGAVRGAAGGELPAPPVVYSWSVEECILAACGGAAAGDERPAASRAPRSLACRVHGEIALADVAPDTMMLDVEAERVARWESVTRGRLLGRGAFGLVFRAEWRRDARAPPESVALKVLQPVPPGAGARASARQAYKAAVSRWAREPAAAACRAYCAARQELAVLAPLRHAHVAPLLAVCTAPLALLLELAPMGALDTLLREYRGCGARVGARAARALALQVARALEYLHARRIIYRDLKAENVLVWRCPQPQGAAAAERSSAPLDVLVKLGDYGISRLTLPSGTKGFGGTEGFMAPEIMRYNGEEEYTEKVDCFSFGMYLYELLTLRQPFQGHEAVKEAILEGARPPLAPKDTAYPCYMLDLMCCCWCGQPEPRPSASGLVSLCSAPEYAALQDVAAVHAVAGYCAAPPVAASAARVAGLAEDGGDGWEVWWGDGCRIQTMLVTPTAFTQHHTIKMPPEARGEEAAARVTALCAVGAEMWVGDSAGRVTVYDVATCAVAWSCRAEESVGGAGGGGGEATGGGAGVAALLSLAPLPRVALATAGGRLFLVTSRRPPAEGGFVLTELGAASALACLAAAPAPDGRWGVWCGGEALWCYEVGAGGVAAAHALPAEPGACAVALLAASDEHVFAYSSPGCVVYQWCVRRRAVAARLDCGKLAPCSESLRSMAIEERLSAGRCQVTALCASGGALYAGTAWGCVVVAEALTLRPITVFRPHEENVAALVALRPRPAPGEEEGPAMLASLGAGYRSLLARYTDLPAQLGAQQGAQAGVYCLLWRAGHWPAD